MPERRERLGKLGVVDVASGAPEQIAVEDENPHARVVDPRAVEVLPTPPPGWISSTKAMQNPKQKYRLRAPGSGREAIAEASAQGVYVDRESGEEMTAISAILPLAPSESALIRTPENLRACGRCDQLIGLDVSDCPYCGLRQEPATAK